MLAIVAALTLPLAPPGGAGTTVEVVATGSTAADGAFSPGLASISLGDSVSWRNANATARHTVTSTSPNWDVNRDLAPGETFAFEFPSTGTFSYRCLYHSGMTGEVAVAKGLDPDLVVTILGPPVSADTGSRDVTYVFNVTGSATHPTDRVLRVQWREVVGTAPGPWSNAFLGDAGAWSFQVDTSNTPSSTNTTNVVRKFQVRAETENAFSGQSPTVEVRIVHVPFAIELVSPSIGETNVVRGRVPVVVKVTHPYWSPGSVSVTLATTSGGLVPPGVLGWPGWWGNASVSQTTQFAQTGQGDLVRGGSLYTLSALSTSPSKWPEGKWDTYRLADGTYSIQVNVAPPKAGSGMSAVQHNTVVVDNRVDLTGSVSTTPGKNAGTIAGTIQASGTFAHASKPVTQVLYSTAASACAAIPPASPSAPWRAATLGDGTWSFALDTVDPASKVRNNVASCLYVRGRTAALSPSSVGTHGYAHEGWISFPFTANNTERKDFRFDGPLLVTAQPTPFLSGPSIGYRVANDGNTLANVVVRFEARGGGVGWHEIGSVSFPVAGYTTVVREGSNAWPWQVSLLGPFYHGTWEVRAVLDPANVHKETSENPAVNAEGNNVSGSVAVTWNSDGTPIKVP